MVPTAGWRPALALAGLHLLVAGLAFDSVPHPGGDNTAYLSLARSLLEHGRYLELWDPATPPHMQYPPGFPVMLAGALAVGIDGWLGLKALMLACGAAAVALSYLWMGDRTSPSIALGAGLLLAVAPGVAGESHWILSDVPFWALTMAALLVLGRGRIAAGVLLAFLAFTFRAAGFPLLAAIAVWLAVRGSWKGAAGVVIGVVVVMGIWTLRGRGIEMPYASQFWLVNPYMPEAGRVGAFGLLDRVWENAGTYGFGILMRMLAGAVGMIADVAAAGLVAFSAVGLWRRLRRGDPAPDPRGTSGWRPGLVEVFAVLYVGMILLWPAAWASDRFLFPLIPVILAYAAEGVGALRGARTVRAVRVGGTVALLFLASVPLVVLWQGAAECRAHVAAGSPLACLEPSEHAFIALAESSEEVLPTGAVVLSRKPPQWYWFGGTRGRTYPFTTDTGALLDMAEELGAGWVVLDRLGAVPEAYLLPSLAADPGRYCVEIQVRERGSQAMLLRILPPDRVWDTSTAPEGALSLPSCPAP